MRTPKTEFPKMDIQQLSLCWVCPLILFCCFVALTLNPSYQWAYRIPFAIQWIWPVLLFIAISVAPESPWWCVRRDRIDDVKANLRPLVDSRTASAEALDNMVKTMI
ncbi:major facilitator superfamily transporter [Fusarium napiforme]|uniref:Major facilitator superfamily transporter n=1 Tax=Fusarium napiforme TaxID=42672 RepID=A0A8H5IN30_9HYPO|nr:major facilitator superfamily transporter [Fusarium napiforme]